MKLFPGSLLISLAFSGHGFRKGSLNQSGAMTACLVGYLSLANDLKLFGVLLLSFYFAGSRATKVKASIKAQYEEGHEPRGPDSGLAGNRNAAQVLCNSVIGTAASLGYRFLFGDLHFSALEPPTCPLEGEESRLLLYLSTCFYAACMGDTLASELGMLSSSKPRMITTGAVVHPGCNGGVTTWGTLCSLAGGTFIGLLALLDLWIEQKLCYSTSSAFVLVSIATLAGGLGSAFDSILGATLQQTLYSEKERRVIKSIDQPTQDVRCVAGRNVLSNDQVNIIASSGTAILLAMLVA